MSKTKFQCGCYVLVFAFNIFVCGWSVNYLLDVFANKMLPFFWAAVIGLFVGEVSFPVAVVVAILKYFQII